MLEEEKYLETLLFQLRTILDSTELRAQLSSVSLWHQSYFDFLIYKSEVWESGHLFAAFTTWLVSSKVISILF